MPAAKSNKIVSVLLCLLGFTYSFSLSAYERNHRLSIGASNVSKADTMQLISNNEVKVVYFHGKGQLPFLGWKDRLDRTLKDVSRFYEKEFAKQGKFIEGIPFEMGEDKRLKLHVVEGQKEASRYGIHSGAEIEREISTSLAGTVDMDNDHVLVITALGYKNEDGSYVFHSPYYGRGGARSGLCIVVDCDLLDVKNLTDTVQSMSFSEMAVDGKQCSVAEFNSWYIGGIAHEMGHLFGLYHDFGHPIEWRDPSFISLMGQHGSRHY